MTIALVLFGLAMFIAGQWWGQRQFKTKAEFTVKAVSGAFEAYRRCMHQVLKEKGEDIDAIEKAALDIQIKNTVSSIEEHLRSMPDRIAKQAKDEEKNGS